jgi:PAS domain S-box-containing protein
MTGEWGTDVSAQGGRVKDSILARLLTFAASVSMVTVLVGSFVLIGWLASIDAMKAMAPGLAPMRPNTSLCTLALGLALFLAVRREQRGTASDAEVRGQQCLSVAALGVVLLTLAEYVWGTDFGIDNLLGVLAVADADPRFSVRISPITSTAIALGASALLLLTSPRASMKLLAQGLATLLSVLMWVIVYGYLYDVHDIYLTLNAASVAPHTAAVLLLVGLAILALTARHGWVADFVQPTPSAAAARRTLLAILAAIPLIGLLRYAGQQAGLYGTGVGMAIVSVLFSVLVVVLLWLNARRAGVAEREIARLSRLYAQLSQTRQAILRCSGQDALYPQVCQVAVDYGQFDFAWIGLLDAEAGATRVVASAGNAPAILTAQDDSAPACWPYATSLLANKYLFSIDADAERGVTTPWHSSALRAGFYTAAIPIRHNDTVIGAFNLYAREPEFFAPYAVPTLQEVALDISFALDNYAREAARTAALQALQASERRYEELARWLPAGLFSLTIDGDGRFHYSYVSPQYCQLLGVSAALMLRDADALLAIVHADDRAEYQRLCDRIRETVGLMSFDLRFMVADEVRWIRTLGQRNPHHAGDATWSGVVIDITEQVHAEHERDRLRAQLVQAQKMEALGQLTGGIAHDFNNILGSVLGFATLALAKETPDPHSKLAQYLTEVRQGAERARDLVAKMLTFSRVEQAETVTDLLQPRVALEEVLKLLDAVLPASIEVVREYDEPLPGLALSAVAFHQLVMNLAINARDAMQGDGRLSLRLARRSLAASVCSSCQRTFEGEYVALTVSDNGPGIAPEHVAEIFQPFFSTKEVGKGTGLGLAMVHGIVHDADGHILLSAARGHGTRFQLLFPLRNDVAPVAPMVQAPRVPVSGGGAHVAVVDDETALTLLWREWLEGSGYRVSSFNDSTQALAAFNSAPAMFDALVLDMTMPHMSGDALARHILQRRPDLPVFICTGYSDRLEALLAKSVGIRGVFTKPVDFDAALKALAEVLRESRDAATG